MPDLSACFRSLRPVLHPALWNRDHDPMWDGMLRAALASGAPLTLAYDKATIGGVTVHVADWPHGYGAMVRHGRVSPALCRGTTALRLRDAVREAERQARWRTEADAGRAIAARTLGEDWL